MVKLNRNYSDYTDETDPNYPEGKAINATTSESYDGTPCLDEFMNDINAAHIAMYEMAYGSRAGISGKADTQKSSQFADAVAKYIGDKVKAHTDQRGLANGVHGATSEATPGQIVSRDEYGCAKVSAPIGDNDIVTKKWIIDLIENIKKEERLAGHPKGSYYWSDDPTDPKDLFGGEWERVEGRAIIAAGTATDENGNQMTFNVGDKGGNYKIQLTESNLPEHAHNMEHKHTTNTPSLTGWVKFKNRASSGNVTAGGGTIVSSVTSGSEYYESENKGYAASGNQVNFNVNHSHTTNSLTNSSGQAITNTGTVGSSESFSIMPPYEVAYCWKRIA